MLFKTCSGITVFFKQYYICVYWIYLLTICMPLFVFTLFNCCLSSVKVFQLWISKYHDHNIFKLHQPIIFLHSEQKCDKLIWNIVFHCTIKIFKKTLCTLTICHQPSNLLAEYIPSTEINQREAHITVDQWRLPLSTTKQLTC